MHTFLNVVSGVPTVNATSMDIEMFFYRNWPAKFANNGLEGLLYQNWRNLPKIA